MSEHALEQRVRATLHRRAADIDVEPPPWEELVGRASGVVVPLRTTDTGPTPAHLRPPRRPRRLRLPRVSLRPALATAAALLVVIGAAVIVDGRLGPDDGEGGQGPASDGQDVVLDVPGTQPIPAPGSTDFRPDLAAPLPLDSVTDEAAGAAGDPTTLAQLYLSDVGLAGSALVDTGFDLQIDPFKTHPEDLANPTQGTVWWSVWDRAAGVMLADGGVFLRVADPAARTWEIVGAYTASSRMSLTGVRRGGGVLAFTVGDYLPDPVARVVVDRAVVHDGPIRGGDRSFTLPDPAPGDVVTIQVQHLENGFPVAFMAMAVPPEEELAAVESGGGVGELPAASTVTTGP